MAEESAAPTVSPEESASPSPVFTSGTGTEPDSAGIAGLQQYPATSDAGIWLAGGHVSGKMTISSGYSVTIEATTPPAHTGRESTISAQLQELMSSGETGNLTITRQTAQGDPLEHLARLTPSLQMSTPAAAGAADSAQIVAPQTEMTPLIASFNQLTSLKTPVDQSTEKASPAQQESLRQEVKGQFIEAKIETRDKGADNQGQQPGQQNMATDAKLFATPLAASGTSDQTTAFFQLNQAVMSQALPQHMAATPAPVAPPPGAPVADDFIFNQVAERFQLHTRNQETQLHIKLNPAELGELKIDLTMKEGSIRAHIVAQSGQVQEVLEKNMVRLKSILEGQGFTIEEILVSIKAEDTGSFGPQQDQLSRGNTAGQQSRQQKETSFDDTYDRVVAAAAGPATGVNITA
jgi:flagellar hook-length control protein FliK